jgi:hypothetical protein
LTNRNNYGNHQAALLAHREKSGIGYRPRVVLASVAKTWWDSRINLIAGLTFLIALTILYFLLRPNALQNDS